MQTNLEEFLYNIGVNDAELWREVGRLLKQTRLNQGLKFPNDIYKIRKGPQASIVNNHEDGTFLSFASLEHHCKVLGIVVVDLLKAALDKHGKPLSPEAGQLVRQFEALSVESRDDVRRTVALVLRAEEALAAVKAQAPEPPKKGPRKT